MTVGAPAPGREAAREADGTVAARGRAAPPLDATSTRLDELLPTFHFRSSYSILVEAPAAAVVAAADRFRLDRSPFVRLLFRLRGLGSAPSTLRSSLSGGGFILLAEEPGREIVFGVAGRFWAIDERGGMVALPDARAFVEFDRPGFAKAAVNLLAEAVDEATTCLSTETRVECCDTAAYRSFRRYWMLIAPFSGWIRRVMLRGIRLDTLELQRGRQRRPER